MVQRIGCVCVEGNVASFAYALLKQRSDFRVVRWREEPFYGLAHFSNREPPYRVTGAALTARSRSNYPGARELILESSSRRRLAHGPARIGSPRARKFVEKFDPFPTPGFNDVTRRIFPRSVHNYSFSARGSLEGIEVEAQGRKVKTTTVQHLLMELAIAVLNVRL
jgi:hypothetical protein